MAPARSSGKPSSRSTPCPARATAGSRRSPRTADCCCRRMVRSSRWVARASSRSGTTKRAKKFLAPDRRGRVPVARERMDDVSNSDEEEAKLSERMARYIESSTDHGSPVGADPVTTHLELALAYAEMGLIPDAVSELEHVLKLDPMHVVARAALQMARTQLGSDLP